MVGNVRAAFEAGYKILHVIATNYDALQNIKTKLEGIKIEPDQQLRISYLLPRLELLISQSQNN